MDINFAQELNEEQLAAVTSPIGQPALVLAGAGSGKTRTLTYRVAYLLSQGIKPWEILLLTFTNKAAKEMLERVGSLTGVDPSKFWGGTFHSIGQRMLRMNADKLNLNANFNILDAQDADSLLSEVIKDKDPAFSKDKNNPKARVVFDVISYARNVCEPLTDIIDSRYPHFDSIKEKIILFAYEYTSRKRKQEVLDYDDLLELWLKLLQDNPDTLASCQQRFKAILVDEYQDTNTIQSKIIDLLAAQGQVMVVGDDAQCIYTWRGAKFENIMTFPERYNNATVYKIETNYRSRPEILELANGVLDNQPATQGYKKELKPVRSRRGLPYFVNVMDGRQQAQFVMKRIQGLVSEGYGLSDIAVLYRAHFHAMDLQMELSKVGVPYFITSGVKFFDQAHIKDLVAQLRFVSNPLDESAFARFTGLLPKVGPKTSQRLLKLAKDIAAKEQQSVFKALDADQLIKKVPEAAKEVWTDMAYTLQDLADSINTISPVEAVKLVVDGWYGDYLRNIYTNWRSRQDDLESIEGFANRFDNMPDMLAQLILLNSETSDRSVDLHEDALRLTTIHQAKGLEYPIVFVIGLADGMFPLKRAIEAGDVDEERRLFYVSVTRAKDELYLIQPKVSQQGGPPTLLNPSRFIQELPENLYDTMKIADPNRY